LKQVLRHARHLLLGSLTSVSSQTEVHPRPPQAYAFYGGARTEQFPHVGDTNIPSASASAPASRCCALAVDFFRVDTVVLRRLYVLFVVRREVLVDRVEVIDLRRCPVVAGW
jgi:hypothetical protein